MFLTFMDNISEYQNIIEIIKENIQKYHQTKNIFILSTRKTIVSFSLMKGSLT